MKISKKQIFIIKTIMFWVVSVVLFSKISYKGGLICSFVGLIIFITLDLEEKFLFILSTLPLAAIFKIAISTPSSIVILYLLFLGEYYLKKKKINKKMVYGIIGFVISQLITVLIFEASIISIGAFCVNIIFCATAYEYLNRECRISFKDAAYMFSISMTINIISAQIFPFMARQICYDKQVSLESAGRFAALNGDSNYYSQLVAVAICMLLAVLIRSKSNRILNILWMIFLGIEGLKSGSKSFVVIILIIMIIFAFLILKNSKKDMKFIIKSTILIVIALVCIIGFAKFILIPLFIERSLDNTSLFSNREDIWQKYLFNIKRMPVVWFIGTGVMNGGNILANGAAAHNVYIELFAETGVLGILSILLIWKNLMFKFVKNISSFEVMYVGALFITSLSLSLSSNDAIFVLLPILALLSTNNKLKSHR